MPGFGPGDCPRSGSYGSPTLCKNRSRSDEEAPASTEERRRESREQRKTAGSELPAAKVTWLRGKDLNVAAGLRPAFPNTGGLPLVVGSPLRGPVSNPVHP